MDIRVRRTAGHTCDIFHKYNIGGQYKHELLYPYWIFCMSGTGDREAIPTCEYIHNTALPPLVHQQMEKNVGRDGFVIYFTI
jgi:hypothetical protein